MKNIKNWKTGKREMEFWKNEGGRLGRFKNRNEARKKVMNS